MSKRRKWQFAISLTLTLYLPVSIPFYLSEATKLENFAVLATLYFALIFLHVCFLLFAAISQWLAYTSRRKIFFVFANLFLLMGGGFVFPSYLVLLPLFIVNLIIGVPKKSIQIPS